MKANIKIIQCNKYNCYIEVRFTDPGEREREREIVEFERKMG